MDEPGGVVKTEPQVSVVKTEPLVHGYIGQPMVDYTAADPTTSPNQTCQTASPGVGGDRHTASPTGGVSNLHDHTDIRTEGAFHPFAAANLALRLKVSPAVMKAKKRRNRRKSPPIKKPPSEYTSRNLTKMKSVIDKIVNDKSEDDAVRDSGMVYSVSASNDLAAAAAATYYGQANVFMMAQMAAQMSMMGGAPMWPPMIPGPFPAGVPPGYPAPSPGLHGSLPVCSTSSSPIINSPHKCKKISPENKGSHPLDLSASLSSSGGPQEAHQPAKRHLSSPKSPDNTTQPLNLSMIKKENVSPQGHQGQRSPLSDRFSVIKNLLTACARGPFNLQELAQVQEMIFCEHNAVLSELLEMVKLEGESSAYHRLSEIYQTEVERIERDRYAMMVGEQAADARDSLQFDEERLVLIVRIQQELAMQRNPHPTVIRPVPRLTLSDVTQSNIHMPPASSPTSQPIMVKHEFGTPTSSFGSINSAFTPVTPVTPVPSMPPASVTNPFPQVGAGISFPGIPPHFYINMANTPPFSNMATTPPFSNMAMSPFAYMPSQTPGGHINADSLVPSPEGDAADCDSKRRFLSDDAVNVLNDWYEKNKEHPYPVEDTVEVLSQKAVISSPQVKKWMANKRVRAGNTLPFNGAIHPKKLQKLIQIQEIAKIMSPQEQEAASKQITTPAKHSKRLLNPQAVETMNRWYYEHLHYPYPNDDEKVWLAKEGDINISQVTCWFANKRNRSNNTRKLAALQITPEHKMQIYDQLKKRRVEPVTVEKASHIPQEPECQIDNNVSGQLPGNLKEQIGVITTEMGLSTSSHSTVVSPLSPGDTEMSLSSSGSNSDAHST